MARRKPLTVISDEPCIPGRTRYPSWKDHPFVPSGISKTYLCALHGCQSGGQHQACQTCGWPEDEHPETAKTL